MGLLAAHLIDADIVVVNADGIVYREPGFALLEDNHLVTGAAAYATAKFKPRSVQNAYWSRLSTEPLTDSRFHHLSTADLATEQLETLWQKVSNSGDRLAVAVPHYMNNESLGLLLGIALELKIPIVAMVDSAVAATRRRYENAVAVHIDISLHASLIARLAQDDQVQIDKAAVVDAGGVVNLYDRWLKLIAEAFVQQSRFDPLHTAETEQLLQDRMPSWLTQASAGKAVTLTVEYGGISHTAEVEAIEFSAAAAPIYQSIVSNLRALLRADEIPAIQMTARAAQMPGLAEALKARVGGEVFFLEAGATARGLLGRCPAESAGSGVTLTRRLPLDQSTVFVEIDSDDTAKGQPTHVLFGDQAFSLNGKPLTLGSQADDNERHLDLPQDMPGVSRRHCVLGTNNGQHVVTDHSRYGTYLNGHRIDSTAVLQTGDLLRIGTPGFEFRLIEVEGGRGS